MLKIERTNAWPPERMADVWPSVMFCIRKFVAEFPNDMTENFLVKQLIEGKRDLWVVYDEEKPERALLSVITEVKKNTATEIPFLEVIGIGGERIHEALPLLDHIEKWAWGWGLDDVVIIGRFGWIPLLKKHGYTKKAVIMEKRLQAGEV